MISSIAMGAKYLFYMKSIETHARAFLALIILPVGTVSKQYNFTTHTNSLKSHRHLTQKVVIHFYINDDDENRMARVCSKTQNALHAF